MELKLVDIIKTRPSTVEFWAKGNTKYMNVEISVADLINETEVVELYKANGWSSADKPNQLLPALRNSHSLVTARINGQLIGIGNAISDG